jgi:hypothetical protein
MCKANPKVVLKQLGNFLDALFDPPPPHTHTNKIPQGGQKDVVYHHFPNYQKKFGNQLVVQFLKNFL